MMNSLGWKFPELHRRKARLTMIFKIQQNIVAIPLPPFIIRPARPKPELPHVVRVVYASTESYRNSFYIRTMKDWNRLPVSTGTLATSSLFKDSISPISP